MKGFFSTLLLLAVCLNLHAAIKAGTVSVDVNGTTTISLAYAYQSTLNQGSIITYRWSTTSSNITITSQSAYSCTIKGTAVGTAQVDYYCSYWIGNNYRTMDFYYTVTVNGAPTITISPSSISLSYIGATATVKATQPGYVGGVYFTSTDESVAKVGSGSSSGYITTATVTATGAGTAYIYAHSAAGVTSDACMVTVTVPKTYQSLLLSSLPDMTYGITPRSLPSTTEQGLSLTWTSSNNNVASINSSKLHIRGAGTSTIRASNSGNSSYYPFSASFSLTVNKASLTIAANDCTKMEGEENPELTVNYSGFVNDENKSVLITQPSVTTTATKESPAGKYPITVSGASAANYDITYVYGTLTVEEDPTCIEKVRLSPWNTKPVFNLSGQKLGENSKLPKGLYILDGKTIFVR